MPTFDSRGPISVNLEVGIGEVRLIAGDRTDTVVEVRPADPDKLGDVTAAEQTRVDFSDGALRIKTPRGWRHHAIRATSEAVHVIVELPAGSTIRGSAGIATLITTGRLGDCNFKSGAGDVRIEHAAGLNLRTAAGDISVGRAAGNCDISTASGAVHLGSVDGTVVVKNSNGDTEIDDISGDLRVKAANGKVTVGRAGSTVAVATANGDIRLGEVSHGTVVARTAYGRIEVGVRNGVAAWLDLNTGFGKVHNDLDAGERPTAGEETVEIKAQTGFGDVTVLRAVAP
jgi:hypothetical protein